MIYIYIYKYKKMGSFYSDITLFSSWMVIRVVVVTAAGAK